MNICFFSREYPPDSNIGGIGTYTHNMATALNNLGHQIHVMISSQNSEKTFEDNGIWVHQLKDRKAFPKELRHFKYSFALAKKVFRLDCQFDIVQSSEYASEAFWFSFKKKCPLVTRLATPFYLANRLDGRAVLQSRPFLNWMEREQTIRSDGIFASTKSLAEKVIGKWGIEPSRIEVIPNSINISRVIRLGKNRLIPEVLKSDNYLLYFGRLEIRKGVRVLAQALPPVLEQFPHIKMVFVGSDSRYHGLSMRQHILKKLENHRKSVIFFDSLPYEELFPIVNSAKIVILPSLWEAFGFVCVEAMALGRPVIATSGSGFEEIIEDNISGFLVVPGDSKLLTEKIISSLKDKQRLERISDGARKRAQDFEVSRIALRLLSFYEKIREKWEKRNN